MCSEEATRRMSQHRRVQGSGRTKEIIPDFERGALYAGLLFAASFGSMFLYAAVMF